MRRLLLETTGRRAPHCADCLSFIPHLFPILVGAFSAVLGLLASLTEAYEDLPRPATFSSPAPVMLRAHQPEQHCSGERVRFCPL